MVCSGRHSHTHTHTHTHTPHTHTVQPVYFCLLALNCNYICHSVHLPYHTSYPTCFQYLLLQLLVMGKFVNNELERTKIEAAVVCYEVLWAVFTWRWRSPRNMPRRHRGGVRVELYSFVNRCCSRWVVSTNPLPRCLLERSRYPLYCRLRGPQSQYMRVKSIEIPLVVPDFEPRIVKRISSHYTDWATPCPPYIDPVWTNTDSPLSRWLLSGLRSEPACSRRTAAELPCQLRCS